MSITRTDDELKPSSQTHPGKKLMETYCYTCHGPSASHDGRLAPPMIAVKRHYMRGGTSEKEFILEVQNWVKKPGEDHARMFGAVDRYGVMPEVTFPDEAITQIADYIYNNELDLPDWFRQDCEPKGKQKGRGQYGKNKG
ncbi:MAG: hypothetical protein HKN00_05760 [Flavobacteriaceae bacterium]|nr:cytochrome c [Bacteroidia bacterium]MBT8288242.1 cytochrome c [Bacteroidia bacterium]NNF74669.1 hypothetical protein [Flavobacteriaceae bacterium]NNK72082.1 hypothetical protein [Flavobacteriaceae bacterium]